MSAGGQQPASAVLVLDSAQVATWQQKFDEYEGMFNSESCANDEISDLRQMIDRTRDELLSIRSELDEAWTETQHKSVLAVVERLDALLGDQDLRKEGRQGQPVTFTVFCRDGSGGHATTFITSVSAISVEEAKRQAAEECADAWDQEIGTIKVIGVAPGSVSLIEWEDDD